MLFGFIFGGDCIVFLVVAVDITIYLYYPSKSIHKNVIPPRVKFGNLTSF